jgi:hypothetical protein
VFDIAFLPGELPFEDEEEEGWTGLWGRTELEADFRERFVAPIGWWTREDYERQWLEGARRLLDGARESAFVLEAGRLWWMAWREGDTVVLQQRLLVGEEMAPAWRADAAHVPYTLVSKRRSQTEEGEDVSEWQVLLSDVGAFLERRAGTYIPG